jgi:NAD-dependent deacetylase
MYFDKELLQRLRRAKRIVFFTGAGASRESGIPTFREGDNSLWGEFDPMAYASLSGFDRNPTGVWQWYAERRRQLLDLHPNPTHQIIAAWESKTKVTVITQNIYGFHQRAGSRHVIELHGSLAMDRCRNNGHRLAHKIELANDDHPRCPACNSLLRPDVVWFAEELPEEAYDEAELLSFNSDVFVSIGCSMEIFPAASLPYNAKRSGAYLVQINPEKTQLDEVADCNLRGCSGEVLPGLWQAVWEEKP